MKNDENFGMDEGFDAELINELLGDSGLDLFGEAKQSSSTSKKEGNFKKDTNSNQKKKDVKPVKKDVEKQAKKTPPETPEVKEDIEVLKVDDVIEITPAVEEIDEHNDLDSNSVSQSVKSSPKLEVETSHEDLDSDDEKTNQKVEDDKSNPFSAFKVQNDFSDINDEENFEEEDEEDDIDFSNLIEEKRGTKKGNKLM